MSYTILTSFSLVGTKLVEKLFCFLQDRRTTTLKFEMVGSAKILAVIYQISLCLKSEDLKVNTGGS